MATIHLERTLRAPIDHVFELLSDHAGYRRFRGITDSRLTREGDAEPNGLGAVRSIATGPIRFEEEITAFERPTRMGYLIREVNVPIEHDGGMITLESAGGGTHVLWVSTFVATVPLVGRPLGAVMAAVFKRGFRSVLSETERLAK